MFYFLTCLLAVWWALFVSKNHLEQYLLIKLWRQLIWLKATLCFEQPRNHPFISNSEREYLQRKIEDYENERKQLPPLPCRAMIKCSPVWALALSTVRMDHCELPYIVLTYIFPFIVIGSIQLVFLYHQQRFTEVSQRYSPRVNWRKRNLFVRSESVKCIHIDWFWFRVWSHVESIPLQSHKCS